MSMYESTATGLGGGGGGEGSGDGRWGDGLAKVLERGVGLDAAEFDVSCAFYQKFCAMCILFGRMICSIDILTSYNFHITARLCIFTDRKGVPWRGRGQRQRT